MNHGAKLLIRAIIAMKTTSDLEIIKILGA